MPEVEPVEPVELLLSALLASAVVTVPPEVSEPLSSDETCCSIWLMRERTSVMLTFNQMIGQWRPLLTTGAGLPASARRRVPRPSIPAMATGAQLAQLRDAVRLAGLIFTAGAGQHADRSRRLGDAAAAVRLHPHDPRPGP